MWVPRQLLASRLVLSLTVEKKKSVCVCVCVCVWVCGEGGGRRGRKVKQLIDGLPFEYDVFETETFVSGRARVTSGSSRKAGVGTNRKQNLPLESTFMVPTSTAQRSLVFEAETTMTAITFESSHNKE